MSMNLFELIQHLTALRNIHGPDLEVNAYNSDDDLLGPITGVEYNDDDRPEILVLWESD